MVARTCFVIMGFLPNVTLPLIADSAFKGLVLLTLVWIGLSCWKQSSAAQRHLVWGTAMTALLLLPSLSSSLPGWNVLPRWSEAKNTFSSEPNHRTQGSAIDGPRIAQLSAELENPSDRPITIQRIEAQMPEIKSAALTNTMERVAVSNSSAESPPSSRLPSSSALTVTPASPADPRSDSGRWLVGIWSIGALLLLLRLLVSHVCLWHLARRSCRVTHGRLYDTVERLALSLEIRRAICVVLNDRRKIPMTWGLFRPQLLLPADAEAWDDARLQSVLIHELSHVKRQDCQSQLVAQLACALHWVNPLAWFAVQRLDFERERACDDVVLSSGIDAVDYAEHLIGVAAGLQADELATFGAMAMSRHSGLESRLLQVLNGDSNRRVATIGLKTGVLVAISILALPIAMLHAIDSAIPMQDSSDKSGLEQERLPAVSDRDVGDQAIPKRDEEPVQSVEGADLIRKAHQERLQEFAKGLEALGRVLETPEFKQPDSPQSGAASRMLYRMQGLAAEERYRLLKSWTFPAKDRDTIRNFIGLIPDAPPPTVFMRESVPPLDDPIVSTATMLVEAARQSSRIAELAAELKPLVDTNIEGAQLLDQLVFQVRNGGDSVRPRISAVFDDAELDRQLRNAQRTANFALVLWCYRAKALAVVEQTTGSTLKPNPDPGLKHWVPVDLASAVSGNQFRSTSWWFALDDRIGHVCSPWVDHLVFAYPLTGTFEISGEAFNGFWSEGNIGFGGLMFEAWNQGSRRNQVYPINAHENLIGPKPAEFLEQFNAVTIKVRPDRMQVLGNNDVMFEESSPSRTSPFLLLRTTWLSAFRNLKITGQPVIPRQIELLSTERMEGWVSNFYNESQPPDLTVRHSQPETASVAVRIDDPNTYDWATSKDVLHGRLFADLDSPHRQSGFRHGESWLYHHRSLRNRERIAYEFFYQPGDSGIEVHPTLDRLAFLLHPDGIKLHWLTTNRTHDQATGWIATDNIVEERGNRRGPEKLPLRIGEWNVAAVEIRDGRVRLELNGQLVYERPLDSNWGTRFGLYHDRTKTSTRVRNVVLSGDWPEWSPALAANLLERISPLSTADEEAIRAILSPRLTTTDP